MTSDPVRLLATGQTSGMAYLLSAGALSLGFLLVLSGMLHNHFRRELLAAVADRRLPIRPGLTAAAVVAAEVALGILALTSVFVAPSLERIAYLAIAGLFGVYAADLIRHLRSGSLPSCGCPGVDAPIRAPTVMRATFLCGASVWVGIQGPTWTDISMSERLISLLSGLAIAFLILYLPLAFPSENLASRSRLG